MPNLPAPEASHAHTPAATNDATGVMVGLLVALQDDGIPRVAYAGNPKGEPCAAQSVVRLTAADVGRRVALLFEAGDRARPLVIGCMLPSGVEPTLTGRSTTVQCDGLPAQTIVAQDSLVLRCGQASITLLADGTVHISGREVLTEASAANRIRGASVHLN